jgi:alpha,alpha-trehalose phosphorylase
MTLPIREAIRATVLPHDIYPVDPWAIVEHGFHSDALPLLETVMALGNGTLGVRGGFHTGVPSYQPGVLINGFYETWPIEYPEPAYGLAATGQTIVYVPDPTVIRVTVDGEPITFEHAELTGWWRRLNMRRGLVSHRYQITTASGKDVRLRVTRMVSVARPDLVATHMQMVSAEALSVKFDSYLVNRQDTDYLGQLNGFDPRRARDFGRRVLNQTDLSIEGLRMEAGYQTMRSGLSLGIGVNHILNTPYESDPVFDEDRPHVRIRTEVRPGEQLTLDKLTSYRVGDLAAERAGESVDGATEVGLVSLVDDHAQAWHRFWNVADVEIDADPETQQALRWALFQVHQASAQLHGTGIPAKGVTGQAYEGHIFWDTEIFVLPFLAYTRPAAAAGLLRHRYSMLDAARERARVLSEDGALFPWRTIDGHEASAYFVAGTAQYHINASIAYAIRQYVSITGDDDLLWDIGVEMLIETARMWASLGFHRQKSFHIYGVTGPDEYTAMVDDNAYTNLMAQMNLSYAAESAERMRRERPQRWEDLARRLGLRDQEISEWRLCADEMYVPVDSELGVTMQDQEFLNKKFFPFDEVRPDQYPLLLHFHPLVLYRYQVLKQADVVMAMMLLPERFTTDERKANFDYYDPLTTGDSSLSACAQSIVASQIGYSDLAMQYFRRALWMDLGDMQGNTTDGVHVASAGGVWMTIVQGFAGLSHDGESIQFDPRLPDEWQGLRFKLRIRGVTLSVDLTHERLRLFTDGGSLTVGCGEESVDVTGQPVDLSTG